MAISSASLVAAPQTERRAVPCTTRTRSDERCDRQALFGRGFAATVIACLQLKIPTAISCFSRLQSERKRSATVV